MAVGSKYEGIGWDGEEGEGRRAGGGG